jgi:hypothetical protein
VAAGWLGWPQVLRIVSTSAVLAGSQSLDAGLAARKVTFADCDDRALTAIEQLGLPQHSFDIAHHLWECVCP